MPKKNGMPTYKELADFVAENFSIYGPKKKPRVCINWIEGTDVGTPEIVKLIEKHPAGQDWRSD